MSGVEITYGGKKDQRQFVMPDMLIHSPELFDDAIAACTIHCGRSCKNEKGIALNDGEPFAPRDSRSFQVARIRERFLVLFGSSRAGWRSLIQGQEEFHLVVYHSQ